ncbi:MAG: hypothetical protein KJ025_06270 [Burkholderiales bacterium]|nr:hypothetical protein [Burkholderiales bacterium]
MSTADASQEPSVAGWLRAASFALARCRFSVLVLVAGGVLLLTDQGRDLLVAYGEDGKTLRLTAGVLAWALSIWGWARVLLDIRWAELPTCLPCYNFARRWLPRVLGAAAFALVVLSAWQAGQLALAAWSLGGMVVFVLLLWRRRRWAARLAEAAARRNRTFLAAVARLFEAAEIGPASVPPHPTLRDALHMPSRGMAVGDAINLRWIFFVALVATWVLMFALALAAPVAFGARAGAMILLFLWGATWLPVGSALSYFADRWGFPLLTALGLLALASSCTNDNHEIRHAPEPAELSARLTVGAALEEWRKANATSADAPAPFVIVATAGGGIRAAYWTGTVLGALHDAAGPALPQRLFAVSGVSGGSVGATIYRALLALPPAQYASACPEGMMDCARRVLGHDFLGPVSAALLYPDLTQRFVPLPLFPDRGAALERSFEVAFRRTTEADLLQSSLAALAAPRPWPALFLNATWVDNGRRMVASNLRYGAGPEEAFFARANDQLARIGRDLRLSTAAHNSARFPLVSPPGMWKRDGAIEGRLQDGGLFENYGAETALELLAFACATLVCAPAPDAPPAVVDTSAMPKGPTAVVSARGAPVYPLVILISSDPGLPEELAGSPVRAPIRFAYELRSTLRSYERVRSGRGQEAAARLQAWTAEHRGKFFHFRMCDPKTPDLQPPLGWALSSAARERIASYLLGGGEGGVTPSCYDWNAASLREVARLLGKQP